jgi:hypothetical protein
MSALLKQNKANEGRKEIKFSILRGLIVALVCMIIAAAAMPLPSFAAAPTLVTPTNSATNVNNTGINFTWQGASENISYYKFDLATDSSFSAMVIGFPDFPTEAKYTVSTQLSYGTKFYWRVTPVFTDDQVGETSAVWSFTVRSEDTPAQTTNPAPSTPASSTSGATTSTGSNNSSSGGGIMGFIDEIGWPLTLGMVGVIVIFIILLSVLLTQPKKAPAGMGAGMGGGMGGPVGGRMGPQGPQQGRYQGPAVNCPTCGYANTPDRKFCANCGTAMGPAQGFQAPPSQQQQFQQQPYQGMNYQPENPPNQFRPSQPPPFQSQQFGGQQFGQGPAFRTQPMGITCSVCGTQNAPGRQFCGGCGSTLTQASQQQRFGGQQQTVLCPNCGTPSQPGQQWCGNCGGNIPVGGGHVIGTYQSFSCPICGANINRGSNPCPACGTWLDWGR